MQKKTIYLDYASTTAVDPRVLEEMLPYFSTYYGNPSSSIHQYGWEAEEAVEQATSRLASLLSVKSKELIFTSGATESVNLALRGVFDLYSPSVGKHIISAKTEHKAVLDCLDALEKKGAEITWLVPDEKGRIRSKAVQAAIRKDTVMVCLMYVNNETGLLHPVGEIGAICKEEGVLFFCDATQAVGKVPVHPRPLGISLMALSSHKFYGPKGVGALYISSENPRVKLRPQIVGGGQQDGIRSGTLNVPGIVGLGKAAQLAGEQMETDYQLAMSLMDRLIGSLKDGLKGIHFNSQFDQCLPNILNLSIEGVSSPELLAKLSQSIAISSGSACSSNSGRPSHVLRAMGLPYAITSSAIRISVGRFTTIEEINYAAEVLIRTVGEVRAFDF